MPGEAIIPLVDAGGEGLDRLGDGDGEGALLGLLVLPLVLAVVWLLAMLARPVGALLGKAARAVVRLAGAARLLARR